MKRRSFLKAVSSAAASYALGARPIWAVKSPDSKGEDDKVAGLPRRLLGRTDEKVSVVGFPGLSLIHYDQARCTAGIHDAFEKGVNYFDVAPAYGDGECETKMGIGLQGIDRRRIFLACKTKMRDKDGAQKELEQSLRRLKTDYFDLYQMHAIRTPEEVKQALGTGGAIETFLKAKQEGKVRHFGFSAHTTKGALAMMQGFAFDAVMFPTNFIEYFQLGFGKAVLELAEKQGVGVLAIKPTCGGAWLKGAERTRKWWYRPLEDDDQISLALRFTLSQKPVAAGIPPSFLDLLDKAIKAACSYRPITEAEKQKLAELAKGCESIFRSEEQSVALGLGVSPYHPAYPDSPHECCRAAYV